MKSLAIALRHHRSGDLRRAESIYREILRHNAHHADALHLLGVIAHQRGEHDRAIVHIRKAIAVNVRDPAFHSNLGAAYQAMGRLEEAEAHYRAALRLAPDYAEAHNNLGMALQDRGQVAEALASYEAALRLDPAYVEAHWNRALAWLLSGDFALGWPEYEWRWAHYQAPPCRFPQPRWDGSPLQGQTILLDVEQGLGDTMQFIRYAPLVKERGGTVIVGCQASLARLLATCAGVDRVIPEGAPLPPFDLQVRLLSLPGIFRTRRDSIPAAIPYLSPPPGDQPALEAALEAARGMFRAGIVWAGNPAHKNDRNRSCPLAFFRPLAGLPGVALVSLQKGPRAADLRAEAGDLAAIDLGELLGDFADTAAAIARLDLVIAVDTAVAHLAGALGKPVWLLLPFAPDWRWLLDRQDSPWYPTMRLFRQARPGDWPSAFERVGAALQAAAAAHGAAAAPWG